jgi:hypothetical protein
MTAPRTLLISTAASLFIACSAGDRPTLVPDAQPTIDSAAAAALTVTTGAEQVPWGYRLAPGATLRMRRRTVMRNTTISPLFFESDEVCETSYKDRGGKYQGQQGVTLPKA